MSNQEHLDILKQGVEFWNIWRMGDSKTNKNMLSLCAVGAHPFRTDPQGRYWREPDLSGADLSGANFIKANLSRANLNGADLSGAKMIEADLRKANLREKKAGCKRPSITTLQDHPLTQEGEATWFGCKRPSITTLQDTMRKRSQRVSKLFG